MAYRGEDLDLRTPQGRLPRETYTSDVGMNGTRPRVPGNANGRSDAVYVDETVLACCNHAFDIAQAHGANEVRLEHLVHALTRVEAAAEILEQRGIREAHLRRESAAVIASEIPVGLAHSHAAPRSSVEFEDVLRRASDQGRGRSVAGNVHDLLWVLLNYNREIPAIALLLRHARDWQSWDWPHKAEVRREEYREPRRETVYTERRVYAEATPTPPRQRVVERIVEEAPPQVVERIVEREPQRPQVVERIVERETPRPQVVERVVEAPQPVVYSQSVNLDPIYARLDHMDSSLRKMQNDMRDVMREAMREMTRDFQREIANMPRGGGSLPTGFLDRFEGIERTLDQRVQEFGRTATTMNDRLQALEKSMQAGMQEGARNWAALGDRLKTIDKVAAMNPNSEMGDLVTEQLITVTTQVQAATEKLQAMERTFEGKMRSLDEGVSATRRDGSGVAQLINERFQTVRQQIEQQNLANTSLVAQLTEPVTERLRQLETLVSRPADNSVMGDRLGRVEQAVAAIQQATSQSYQLTSQVGERIRAIEGTTAAQPQSLQGMTTKLAHLEQLIQSHGDRAVQYTQQVAQQAADAHTRELSDLQEALVKLGTNQQTLSESLDQWRTENEGGLSILSNRLEVLESSSAQPMQMLKQMQTDLVGLQKVTIADYDQNRRGIRHWLFGTEELFAGSWRDETRQIRERLTQARHGIDERKA
jgi:hypothetical protein